MLDRIAAKMSYWNLFKMNDFELEANIEWFTVLLAVKWVIPTSSGNCMNDTDSKSSFESLLLARRKLSEGKL